MRNNFLKETGSALMTAIVISVIITATLLVILAFSHQQTRFIHQKENFLQARYTAESGLHKTLAALAAEGTPRFKSKKNSRGIPIADGDSARITQFPWGGYIFVASEASKKQQAYTLKTLVGMTMSPVFHHGLVISPRYYSLVVTGDTRLYGDVLVGKSGVKSEALRGRPYTGDRLVYGNIIKTSQDQRPSINQEYLDHLFDEFKANLHATQFIKFNDLVSDAGNMDTSQTVYLSQGEDFPVIYVTNEQLNQQNRKIRGPGILFADEPLILQENITFSNYIKIVCREHITVSGSARLKNVILYSPQRITISNNRHFQGQLYSEEKIVIRDQVKLHYPSIAMVYSRSDTGSIHISSGSEISGSVIYVTRDKPPIPTHQRGKIIVDDRGTVNGLVFSDNLVTLTGRVNGTVITERFHFYYSPTDYYNWIRDGVVNRRKLNRHFKLPVFFDLEKKHFTPVRFTE